METKILSYTLVVIPSKVEENRIYRVSQQVLVKISNLREIRILKFFVKKNRRIEVRSALHA